MKGYRILVLALLAAAALVASGLLLICPIGEKQADLPERWAEGRDPPTLLGPQSEPRRIPRPIEAAPHEALPHGVEVRGRVVDVTGRPVDDARVEVGALARATGSDGAFVIWARSPPKVVRVSKVGFASQDVLAPPVSPEGVDVGDVTLRSGSTSRVQVIDADGVVTNCAVQWSRALPPSHVALHLVRVDETAWSPPSMTDDDGIAQVVDAPIDEPLYLRLAQATRLAHVQVVLVGQEAPVPVVFPQGVAIMLEPDGPWPEGRSALLRIVPAVPIHEASDDPTIHAVEWSGRTQIVQLPSGRYTIQARCLGTIYWSSLLDTSVAPRIGVPPPALASINVFVDDHHGRPMRSFRCGTRRILQGTVTPMGALEVLVPGLLSTPGFLGHAAEGTEGRAQLAEVWKNEGSDLPVQVSAWAPGYDIGSESAVLRAGDTLDVKFVLRPSTGIEGRLAGAASGSRIDLHLLIDEESGRKAAYEEGILLDSTTVQETGAFRLGGFRSGTYDLRLLGEGGWIRLERVRLVEGETLQWTGEVGDFSVLVRPGGPASSAPDAMARLQGHTVDGARVRGKREEDGSVRFVLPGPGDWVLGWEETMRQGRPAEPIVAPPIDGDPRFQLVRLEAAGTRELLWRGPGPLVPATLEMSIPDEYVGSADIAYGLVVPGADVATALPSASGTLRSVSAAGSVQARWPEGLAGSVLLVLRGCDALVPSRLAPAILANVPFRDPPEGVIVVGLPAPGRATCFWQGGPVPHGLLAVGGNEWGLLRSPVWSRTFDESGALTFPLLPAGSYRLVVWSGGAIPARGDFEDGVVGRAVVDPGGDVEVRLSH